MNVTKFDVGMLFSLSLFVIIMSFAGPAFGLTSENATAENDIPELDVDNGTFDRLDGFPEQEPGNPSGGTLNFTEGTDNGQSINREFITGSYQKVNGLEVLITKYPVGPNDTANILVYEWNSGSLVHKSNESVTEGEKYLYENQSQGIVVEFNVQNVDHDLYGNGTDTAATEYNVRSTPSDKGIFNNMPIVGGIIEGTNALAGIVGWIGSVILYLFQIVGETVINTFIILTNIMTYMIDLLAWMTTTYLDVIDNAPGWSRVIVAVPGVLLAAVLSKFVAIGISLLPTT